MRCKFLLCSVLFIVFLSLVARAEFTVSVKIMDAEISPGENLFFEIGIDNINSKDKLDATVVYRIDNGDRYSSSVPVVVFPGTSTVLGKTFEILFDEPGGVHELTVSVSNASVTVTEYASFSVDGAETTTTAEPVSSIQPSVETLMEITDYPDELEIEKGWMKYANIGVNNSGDSVLHDIELKISGVPLGWAKTEPEIIKNLAPGKSETFLVSIDVPSTAEPGNYPIKFIAADETSAEVNAILRIFSTKAELLLFNLETIRERLAELENSTLQAGGEKNITAVSSTINEIKDKIRIAEKYTNLNDYDVALEVIRGIKDLLERAVSELEEAPEADEQQNIFFPAVVLIIIAVAAILLYWLNKRKGIFEKYIKQSHFEMKRIAVSKESAVELQKEKMKIEKMLNILKKEYNEGLISERSYQELKTKNEKRLSDIENKIGGMP